MATEPKPTLIAEQILARLAAIRGDQGETYWYTPVVVRSEGPDERLLDTSLETVYALTPDRKEERRATNDGPGCIIDARAFFTLTLLGQCRTPTTNPFVNTGITRDVIQERMKADASKALRSDANLGGVSIDLTITETEEGPPTFVEGWAMVLMRLMVRYHYAKEAA